MPTSLYQLEQMESELFVANCAADRKVSSISEIACIQNLLKYGREAFQKIFQMALLYLHGHFTTSPKLGFLTSPLRKLSHSRTLLNLPHLPRQWPLLPHQHPPRPHHRRSPSLVHQVIILPLQLIPCQLLAASPEVSPFSSAHL